MVWLKKISVRFLMIVAFVAGVISTANACNYSSITLVGSPIDNGNGTYTITLDVCVGLMISWGGTTDFTLTLSGGSFTSVASIQTPTFNTAYSYCSANCVGNTCPGSLLSGGCASPITNGGNTLDFTGCGNSPGNWIAPDDYAAVCVTNPNNLCQTVTFTTNGYPGSISMGGVEDDFGPTAGNGGGCPETLTLPQPSISTCTGTFYDSGGGWGDYSNSENATYTYCSDNGGPIVFDFTYFNIENGWDFLYVFDGPSTASPMLGTYTGTIGPGTITSSGTCFTFVFQSDGSVTAPGWIADISCPTNCVDPVADFFTSSQKCTGSGFDFFNTGSSLLKLFTFIFFLFCNSKVSRLLNFSFILTYFKSWVLNFLLGLAITELMVFTSGPWPFGKYLKSESMISLTKDFSNKKLCKFFP